MVLRHMVDACQPYKIKQMLYGRKGDCCGVFFIEKTMGRYAFLWILFFYKNGYNLT